MKKYPAPAVPSSDALKDGAGEQVLEFPVAPNFLSVPPRLDPQLMLRRLEETMPWRSTRPGEAQRRLAMKVHVEFVL